MVKNIAALTFPEMRATAQGRLKIKFKKFHFITLHCYFILFSWCVYFYFKAHFFYKNIEYTATKYNNIIILK